jgi:predicted nuclease of restriction endonuclease-like (RecB) superfamily
MSELDMKIAILNEFEVLIQEASPDFVLIPPLKQFSVDDEHRVVDLLFYHRNIQCLILVYLKFVSSLEICILMILNG